MCATTGRSAAATRWPAVFFYSRDRSSGERGERQSVPIAAMVFEAVQRIDAICDVESEIKVGWPNAPCASRRWCDRPERYGKSRSIDTMPSRPSRPGEPPSPVSG